MYASWQPYRLTGLYYIYIPYITLVTLHLVNKSYFTLSYLATLFLFFMAYNVKKKINGKLYAYQYTTIWNKLTKKYKKKYKYLGKVDEDTGEIIPAKKKKLNESNSLISKIVDFGDSYAINQILENSGLSNIIDNVFDRYQDNIKALICFQILEGSALKNVQDWINGNIAHKIFKKVGFSS